MRGHNPIHAMPKRKAGHVDFAKRRDKVGKKKARPENATYTQFRSKQLAMPEQSILAEQAAEAVSHRNVAVPDLLTQVAHYNVRVRKQALGDLREVLARHPDQAAAHAARLMQAVLPALTDASRGVRRGVGALLAAVLPRIGVQAMLPFGRLVTAYCCSALTSVTHEVRVDALATLTPVLTHAPGMLPPDSSEQLLQNVAVLLRDCVMRVQGSSARAATAPGALATQPKGSQPGEAVEDDASASLASLHLLLDSLNGTAVGAASTETGEGGAALTTSLPLGRASVAVLMLRSCPGPAADFAPPGAALKGQLQGRLPPPATAASAPPTSPSAVATASAVSPRRASLDALLLYWSHTLAKLERGEEVDPQAARAQLMQCARALALLVRPAAGAAEHELAEPAVADRVWQAVSPSFPFQPMERETARAGAPTPGASCAQLNCALSELAAALLAQSARPEQIAAISQPVMQYLQGQLALKRLRGSMLRLHVAAAAMVLEASPALLSQTFVDAFGTDLSDRCLDAGTARHAVRVMTLVAKRAVDARTPPRTDASGTASAADASSGKLTAATAAAAVAEWATNVPRLLWALGEGADAVQSTSRPLLLFLGTVLRCCQLPTESAQTVARLLVPLFYTRTEAKPDQPVRHVFGPFLAYPRSVQRQVLSLLHYLPTMPPLLLRGIAVCSFDADLHPEVRRFAVDAAAFHHGLAADDAARMSLLLSLLVSSGADVPPFAETRGRDPSPAWRVECARRDVRLCAARALARIAAARYAAEPVGVAAPGTARVTAPRSGSAAVHAGTRAAAPLELLAPALVRMLAQCDPLVRDTSPLAVRAAVYACALVAARSGARAPALVPDSLARLLPRCIVRLLVDALRDSAAPAAGEAGEAVGQGVTEKALAAVASLAAAVGAGSWQGDEQVAEVLMAAAEAADCAVSQLLGRQDAAHSIGLLAASPSLCASTLSVVAELCAGTAVDGALLALFLLRAAPITPLLRGPCAAALQEIGVALQRTSTAGGAELARLHGALRAEMRLMVGRG